MANMGQIALNNVLMGAGVVIITPLLTPNLIPEIFSLGVITVGQALSAGLAAYATSWLMDQFMK